MKVLVTGVNGQLGWEVAKLLPTMKAEVIGVDTDDFDLTDAKAVMAYVCAQRPDAIVHCAAYTAVDKAETEPERCCRVNGMGTLNLVRAALAVDAKLLYVSTDEVFAGDGEEPIEVDAPRHPRSVYGLSKLQGEEAVQSLMTRYFIVRSSWIYGAHGDNFIKAALAQSGDRRELPQPLDQVGAPTYAPDLARLICEMIRTNRYGVYHAAGEDWCTRADVIQTALRFSGRRALKTLPAPAPGAARRPHNARLSMTSLDDASFNRLPNWRISLARYLDEIKY